MSDLDDVLNGEVTDEETTETEETESEETSETESEETEETKGDEEDAEETESDKDGEESEESEKEDEPPSSEDKDTQEPDKVPIKALQDERRKRQDLQERLEALERQTPNEQETKDFWDDPEAHLQGMEKKFQDALLNERMNISESFARKRWEDLDERLESFKGMIEQTPSLRDEMLRHPSPWEFVGEQVERQRKLDEFDSAEEYRKKLDADFEKRVAEEAKKRADKALAEQQEKSEELPGSAADARQAAGRSESDSDAAAAPPSLEEALGKTS